MKKGLFVKKEGVECPKCHYLNDITKDHYHECDNCKTPYESPQAEQATASCLSELLACTMHATATLIYEGIIGDAHWNNGKDGVGGYWYGSLKMRDLVTYEAETVEELKKEFIAAIKDWRKTKEQLVTS